MFADLKISKLKRVPYTNGHCGCIIISGFKGEFVRCHVFEFTIFKSCYQSLLTESASIIWNLTLIASTMTIKAEFIDGQRCWDVS